jgi:quinol---cytochrome c reductase iron-sulfur subunit, bacillus type
VPIAVETDSSSVSPEPSRRSYLGWLVGLCAAGAGAVLAIPLIRFSLYPILAKTTEVKWSDAGPVSDFESLTAPVQRSITVEQLDGWRKPISEKVVYITRNPQGQLQALSAVCPHLGCSVQWRAAKNGFECPCHGASFTPDGSKTGGPSPRGMDALPTQVQNGRFMVRYEYFRQLVAKKEVIG